MTIATQEIQGKWEQEWDGNGKRNWNDPWKMLDKSHHAIYRLDFVTMFMVSKE